VAFNVGFGHGHRYGHRFARRVLVSAGHYEKRWISTVTETRYDDCGRPYTVVIREGYHEKVWISPKYVTRYVPYRRHVFRGHRGHHGGIHVSGHFRF
jgi:hypothetical protein